jgi:hypothetical protein
MIMVVSIGQIKQFQTNVSNLLLLTNGTSEGMVIGVAVAVGVWIHPRAVVVILQDTLHETLCEMVHCPSGLSAEPSGQKRALGHSGGGVNANLRHGVIEESNDDLNHITYSLAFCWCAINYIMTSSHDHISHVT